MLQEETSEVRKDSYLKRIVLAMFYETDSWGSWPFLEKDFNVKRDKPLTAAEFSFNCFMAVLVVLLAVFATLVGIILLGVILLLCQNPPVLTGISIFAALIGLLFFIRYLIIKPKGDSHEKIYTSNRGTEGHTSTAAAAEVCGVPRSIRRTSR